MSFIRFFIKVRYLGGDSFMCVFVMLSTPGAFLDFNFSIFGWFSIAPGSRISLLFFQLIVVSIFDVFVAVYIVRACVNGKLNFQCFCTFFGILFFCMCYMFGTLC